MGRPINKRFFGVPTAGGNEIKVDFHNGSSVTEGYIVKQLGAKKFRVAAIGTPGTTYDRFLTTGKLASALTGTEMAITVKGDDAETYQISKISGRKATIISPDGTGSNALTGTSIAWNFSTANNDSKVQVEEAGDDDVLSGTDDDDFSNA
tara:strand:- start:4102 stop:4551 length:450 start_codon:yes stop_codon:yes gene_type:complete